jgi:glutamate N-acetyltransferase/amino-acid N-acetyltransferase
MKVWNWTESDSSNGLVDVPGFKTSAVHADIRNKRNGQLDLGILHSQSYCQTAGIFTKNRIKAAPVKLCQQLLNSESTFNGVLVNSGNANACTGEQGDLDALAMVSSINACVGEGRFLVCSTGRIGRCLPMEKVDRAIAEAAKKLSSEQAAGIAFADCILTSDTRNKKISISITNGDKKVHISGVAKGAGMIRPDMATMLGFITTDLKIEHSALQQILSDACDVSFNAITVDGDMSTNDTVLMFANGISFVDWQDADSDFQSTFIDALKRVCEYLAYLIVGDGEKITKVVTLEIASAASRDDARKVGYAIAHSPLVKASWAGSDPNWGRVVAAVGYSGVAIEEKHIDMFYDEVPVVSGGSVIDENLDRWQSVVDQKEFTIRINLGMGSEKIRLISSDLTPEYITFNMKE